MSPTRSRPFPSRLLAVLVVAPALAAAQQTTPDSAHARDTVRLSPVVVTATRSPKEVFLTPAPVNVFDRSDIRARAPNTLTDLFRGQAGLDVSGVGLSQVRPVIRGQLGQRILLLVDGERLNNSRRQQDFGEIPGLVDVSTIERVEVVRGPASVLYGTDAIGGVINVFSRTPELAGLHGDAGARYSSADAQRRLFATTDGRFGRWGVLLGGAVRRADDYKGPGGDYGKIRLAGDTPVRDTRGQDLSADAYLGYRLGEGRELFARYQRYRADTAGFGYVDPAAYSPGDPTIRILYPWQVFSKLSTGVRAAGLMLPFADRAEATLYRQENDRRLDFGITIPTGPGSMINIAQINRTDLVTYGLRGELNKRIGERVEFTYGIDYFHDRSTNSDSSTTSFVNMGPIPPSTSSVPQVPNAAYRSTGIFAQSDWRVLPRLSLLFGARYQHITATTRITPNYTGPIARSTDQTVVGAASAVVRVADAVSVVGTVGRAFRSPNLVERFFNGPTPEGFGHQSPNPNLKPETSLNVDLGVRVRTARANAEVFVFQNSIRDGIRIAPTGDSVQGLAEYWNVNVEKLQFRGIELNGRLGLEAGFSLGASATWVDSKNVLDPNTPVGNSYSSSYRGTIRYDHPHDRLFAEYELRGNGDRTDVLPATNPVGATLPGFVIHSVRAGVVIARNGLRDQRLGVGITNLSNALYAEFTNVSFFRPEPGRSVFLTYSVTF
ncbi:MAG TPA: TonB-dependent receptor [Gemmatimonadales bacterium]|nr:TonB-dependent receptor [Gemmatimonadales bacterium]